MREIFELAFTNLNSIWSVLLAVFFLYWIFVILGAIDMDSLDVDVDLDMDMDIDADLDVDADGGTATEGAGNQASFFIQALRFFNLGELPFMVILTIFVLSAWTISVLGNHYIGSDEMPFGWIWLSVTIVGALLATKVITEPIKKIVNPLKSKFAENHNFMGQICEIKMTTSKIEIGQAEVIFKDDPVLVNVRSHTNDIIRVGEKAIIVEILEEENLYLIEPFNN